MIKTDNFKALLKHLQFEENGYHPKQIELEPKWKVGHGASGGRADILVKNKKQTNKLTFYYFMQANLIKVIIRFSLNNWRSENKIPKEEVQNLYNWIVKEVTSFYTKEYK